MSLAEVAQVNNGYAVFDRKSKKVMVRSISLKKPTTQQIDEIAIRVLRKFCEGLKELEEFKGWKRVYQFPKDRSIAIFNGKTIKKQCGCSPNLKRVTEKEKEEIITFILSYGNLYSSEKR